MKPLRPRPLLENAIVERVRRALVDDHGALLVEKTHGNAFQAGWPDLFVALPGRTQSRAIWLEVKRPTGRLTRAQRVRFATWEAAGVGVWVVASVEGLNAIHGPPNWREWE